MVGSRPEAVNSSEDQVGGTSPYATGGGGFALEWRVAASYLAHLLVGDGAAELGDGRRVVSVAFQQAPACPVDDLVVSAAASVDSEPSLVLSLAVRRSPRLVASNESAQKLMRQFVRSVIEAPAGGAEYRVGLVVAGANKHAEQISMLAWHAADQLDAAGFFGLLRTPKAFDTHIVGRLDQVEKLVKRALVDLGEAEPDDMRVQQLTWKMLSRLTVLMPRLEPPHREDWTDVASSLIPVARDRDLAGATALRDRLFALASEFASRSARISLTQLRRRVHDLLNAGVRPHDRGWQRLNHLHDRALESVQGEIAAGDDARRVRLDRDDVVQELVETVSTSNGIIVTGESGVGKSALAVLSLSARAAAEPDSVSVLCINLRQLPERTVEFEHVLDASLSAVLNDLSAPQRVLVIDAADAVDEGMEAAFRYLVDAAQASGMKVVAVTGIETTQVVHDTLISRLGTEINRHVVDPLSDTEIDQITAAFPQLGDLTASPQAREMLRRLVMVDLLVRSDVSGVPLTDADAMRAVWSGLVRREGRSDRGSPDAREAALLRLADNVLRGGDTLDAVVGIDDGALVGLRRDGLLRASVDDPFKIGPEFAHDEVRRYAIARLLLAEGAPAAKILQAGAPRWSLGAVRLACQALLAQPGTAAFPVRGRFMALQASFDALAEAHNEKRWGDVPGEALLALPNPDELLGDAWPELSPDHPDGRPRLARLVDQRHRDDTGLVRVDSVEPMITLLLQEDEPWSAGEYAQKLLRDWLYAHVVAGTDADHRLRVLLRQRLVQMCAAADRRLDDQQRAAVEARAARTPEEIEQERRFLEEHEALFAAVGHGGRERRERPEVPVEITNEVVVELLALLGPDLGDGGEAILHRIAQDAPGDLAPAVEHPFTPWALAQYRPEFLAELTEAYYIDDEVDGSCESDHFDGGIRPHVGNVWLPMATWSRGPFANLFSSDFRNGVRVVNGMLNHAALVHARVVARPAHWEPPIDIDRFEACRVELTIMGQRRVYIGDVQVWCWYRGSTVGPYPCMSALQAVERACDQLIEAGAPIEAVVWMLLEGCENLAMVGLIVGLLVRHLPNSGDLLEPFLAEPRIWSYEFARVVQEGSGLLANTEGVKAPERRNCSLREAAAFMVINANDERAAELRAVGERLVANARSQIELALADEPGDVEVDVNETIDEELMVVRGWASGLDRESYAIHQSPGGPYIQATPPEEVSQALEDGSKDVARAQQATGLQYRYYFEPRPQSAEPVESAQLSEDIASARELLRDPPSLGADNAWDVAALVAAAALEAHLLCGIELTGDELAFSAETVLRVAEGETPPPRFESEGVFFGWGANRSSAQALPLLLLPVAAPLRATIDAADESAALRRVAAAATNCARYPADEVRLHLARGLEHLWEEPCTLHGLCHHEIGLRLVVESMRDCVIGNWDPATGRRNRVALREPVTESLADTAGASIIPSRLDAAIRALGPAAAAHTCVSERVHTLVLALLDAQKRALLAHERGIDHRGTHALTGARALLILASIGDDSTIADHIDAYADNSDLLYNLLSALSAAGEEAPRLAAAARRVWPDVMRRVLELHNSGRVTFDDRYPGDMALAALVPNTTAEFRYISRQVQDTPITWWEPLELQSEITAWLAPAAGRPDCVDQLISFLGVLPLEDQAQTGLPWIATLVLADPDQFANRISMLPDWLIEVRPAAVDVGLSTQWQQVADALVVAGVTQLAPYSQ